MKLCEATALRVKELLKKNGVTQYGLFIKTGVPETTISAVVRALHENVSTRIVWEIAAGLGVSMAEFYSSPLFDYENICD